MNYLYVILYAIVFFLGFFLLIDRKRNNKIIIRNFGIDVAKSLGVFFVIAVHLLGDIGFHEQIYATNIISIITSIIFEIVVSAVPIFLIVSGYLLSEKVFSKNYYKKLIYFILQAGVALLIARIFEYTYTGNVKVFLSTPPYYVPLYIVLYLIAPVINVICQTIIEINKKLFVTLFVIVTLLIVSPDLLLLVTNNEFIVFWKQLARLIYPVMYYLVGFSIKRFGLGKKKSKNKYLLTVLVITICTVFIKTMLLLNTNHEYILGYYNGLPTLLIATFTVLFSLQCETENIKLSKYIYNISVLSLSFYLLASVTGRLLMEYIYPNYTFEILAILSPLFFIVILLSTALFALVSQFIYKNVLNSFSKKL